MRDPFGPSNYKLLYLRLYDPQYIKMNIFSQFSLCDILSCFIAVETIIYPTFISLRPTEFQISVTHEESGHSATVGVIQQTKDNIFSDFN